MSLINSYWDLLDTDIQDFIIKIRDDTVKKDTFKKGAYTFKNDTYGKIDVYILDFSEKTIKIFWNMNKVYPQKYTWQIIHSLTEKKRYKIRYDIHNIPYILFEYSYSVKGRLYFQQLKKVKDTPFSSVWKYLIHNKIY